MITLFAALQNIPKDIYEAARVDGATEWKTIRHIKIPLVIPTLRLLFIFSVIGTSQLFTEALVLRPLGYVADNITPNLYLYLTAARDANYSYAGALAMLLAVFIFIISSAFLRRIGSRGPGACFLKFQQPTAVTSSGSDFVPGGLRYAVFAIFFLYCILPATWILAAMGKDNSQIFTTFGFWFAYPPHFI